MRTAVSSSMVLNDVRFMMYLPFRQVPIELLSMKAVVGFRMASAFPSI